MTYGDETWKLTKQTENSLRIAQKGHGKATLEITLRDRKKMNLDWRKQTKTLYGWSNIRNKGGLDL